MEAAEFDKFAAEYEQLHRQNIKVSGEGPEFFAEYKISDIKAEWSQRFGQRQPELIIDFGGGVGASAPYLRKYFPQTDLKITDVSEKSLEFAEKRGIDGLECVLFDGKNLPFANDSVDLVFAACVFHHIPHAIHISLFKEILRVLRPKGLFFVFEHNPWNPLTLHAVNTCPFDENAELISGPAVRRRMIQAGFHNSQLAFRLFVPGALRSMRPIEKFLRWCPIGAQYFVCGQKHEVG